MDIYGVPKKINRHVLKALYFMNDRGYENPDPSEICEIVEITMKNNIPVRNLHGVVRQSLQNMAQLGVIEKNGPYFFVRNPVLQKSYGTKMFKSGDINDGSKLDPNLKRKRHSSEDSMSGNELEKSRKRFRSSRPIKRKGHCVYLPKARASRRKFNLNADLYTDTCVTGEVNNEDEDQHHSDFSINTILKVPFISAISENEIDDTQSQDGHLSDNKEMSDKSQDTNDDQDHHVTPKIEPDIDEVVTAEQQVNNTEDEDANSTRNSKSETETEKTEGDP